MSNNYFKQQITFNDEKAKQMHEPLLLKQTQSPRDDEFSDNFSDDLGQYRRQTNYTKKNNQLTDLKKQHNLKNKHSYHSQQQFGDKYAFVGDIHEEPTAKFMFYKPNQEDLVKGNCEFKEIKQCISMEEEMKKYKEEQGLDSAKLFADYCSEFSQSNLIVWDEEIIKFANSHDFNFVDCSCGKAIPQNVRDFIVKKDKPVEEIKQIKPEKNINYERRNTKVVDPEAEDIDDLESCYSFYTSERSLQPQSRLKPLHYTHHFDIQNCRLFFQYLYVYDYKAKRDKIKGLVTDWAQVCKCQESHKKDLPRSQSTVKEDQKHRPVYLKMLKIFDQFNYYGAYIADCIIGLGNAEDNQLLDSAAYNVSTIQFKTDHSDAEAEQHHYLYFFQRQYSYPTSQNDNTLKTPEKKEQTVEESKLQLMRINLLNLNIQDFTSQQISPEPVIGYYINEQQGQFRNVIFSQPVDKNLYKYQTEQEFLDSQFIVLQAYHKGRSCIIPDKLTQDHTNKFHKIQLASLKDLKNSYVKKEEIPPAAPETLTLVKQQRSDKLESPLLKSPNARFKQRNLISDTKASRNISEDEAAKFLEDEEDEEFKPVTDWKDGTFEIVQMGVKPIILVHHLVEQIKNKKRMTFLIQDTQQFIPYSFKLNSANKRLKDAEINQANNLDQNKNVIDTNSLQIPIVPVQLLKIPLKLANSQSEETVYYYYIDEQNGVIPVYPLPKEKVLQIRLSEMIKQKIGIQETTSEQYSTVYEQQCNGTIKYCAGQPTQRLLTMLGLHQQSSNIEHQLLKSQMHHTFLLGATECDQIVTFIQPVTDKLNGNKECSLRIMSQCSKQFFSNLTYNPPKNSFFHFIQHTLNKLNFPFDLKDNQMGKLKYQRQSSNAGNKNKKNLIEGSDSKEEFNRNNFLPSLLTIESVRNLNGFQSFSWNSLKKTCVNENHNMLGLPHQDEYYEISIVDIFDIDLKMKTIQVYNMTKFRAKIESIQNPKKKAETSAMKQVRKQKSEMAESKDGASFISKPKINQVAQDKEQEQVNKSEISNYVIKLEWYSSYQKNDQIYYVLFFSFQFKINEQPIKSYFLINKKMQDLLESRESLFDWDTKLDFIYDIKTIKKEKFSLIRQQMKTMHQYFYQGIDSESYDIGTTEIEIKQSKLARIEITFPKCPDNQFLPNHVAMVYQQYIDKKTMERAFVVYDTNNEVFHLNTVQMRQKNVELISKNPQGFENHILCQSSDFLTGNHGNYSNFCQVKYSMLSFFQQEIGLIKLREFLVSQQGPEVQIQIIGMKHIFFSNEFLKNVNYDLLANCSFAVPMYFEYRQPLGDKHKQRHSQENATYVDVIKLPALEVKSTPETQKQQKQEESQAKTEGEVVERPKALWGKLRTEVKIGNIVKKVIKPAPESESRKARRIDGFRLILFTQTKTSNNFEMQGDKDYSPTFKQHSENNHIILNFPDTYCNMLYTFQSNIAYFGCVQTALKEQQSAHSATIISIRLKNKLLVDQKITQNLKDDELNVKPLLTREESLYLLENWSRKMLSLSIPDLKYIMMNNFDQLINKNYFQNQYLLQGRSLCDLSINDYQIVYNACESWLDHPVTEQQVPTFLLNIVQNDSYRQNMLSMLNFQETCLLLNLDFDMQGTINRAIKCDASESIKLILSTILELNQNQNDYYDMIMFDFIEILQSRSLEIDFFFSSPQVEDSLFNKTKPIRLEILLTDFQLPQFSQNENDYELINQVNIFEENLQKELNNIIIEKEKRNKNLHPWKPLQFKVEHSYINLTLLQLSAKLNDLHNDDDSEHLMSGDLNCMNHLTLSKIIGIKVEQNDLNFFKQKSVQQIINMQYDTAKKLLYFQFFVYLFGYFLPFIIINISRYSIKDNKDNKITEGQDFILKLCILTRLMFIAIEFTQMATKKWEYFQSLWNWVDMSEFIGFVLYFCILKGITDFARDFLPEIAYLVMLLAILKFMFFIRMFQSLGFITMMIWECMMSLIPFIITFFTFLMFFTLLLVVLNNDVDAEVEEGAEFLPKFQQAILQTFRTSIGELGLPKYKTINDQPDSFAKYMNIYMIWFTWYAQCFFNLVVMLNFIIAVINSAYEAVKENQETISFKYKADLNQEVFELQNYLFKLQEFTVIQFSQFNNVEKEETNRNQNIVNKITRIINRKKKMQEKITEGIQKNIDEIKSKTLEMSTEVKTATKIINASEQQGDENKKDVMSGTGFNPEELKLVSNSLKRAFSVELEKISKSKIEEKVKEIEMLTVDVHNKLHQGILDKVQSIGKPKASPEPEIKPEFFQTDVKMKNDVSDLTQLVKKLTVQNDRMNQQINQIYHENKEANSKLAKLTDENIFMKKELQFLRNKQENDQQFFQNFQPKVLANALSQDAVVVTPPPKRPISTTFVNKLDDDDRGIIMQREHAITSAKVSRQLLNLSKFIVKERDDGKLSRTFNKLDDSIITPHKVYEDQEERKTREKSKSVERVNLNIGGSKTPQKKLTLKKVAGLASRKKSQV